jgi:hypothetical protein
MIVTVANGNASAAGAPRMTPQLNDYRIKSVIALFGNATAAEIRPELRVTAFGSTITKRFPAPIGIGAGGQTTVIWAALGFPVDPLLAQSGQLATAAIPLDLVIRQNDVLSLTENGQGVSVTILDVVFDIEPLGALHEPRPPRKK